MKGLSSNFREIWIFFLTLQVNVPEIINRGELKLSPACLPFDFEQNDVLFRYPDGIFVNEMASWKEAT